jgi:hypothetical protein
MATTFDIQVRDGVVRITVGGPENKGHKGAESGQDCCAPVVIGPIVISDPTGTLGSLGGSGKNVGTGTGGSGKNVGTGTGGSGKNAGTGTGGDGPDSGCCCPVVIGPIVIGGCSGQGAASSVGFTGSRAVTVNPPPGTKTTTSAAAFIVQTQLASNWCWAAVAVSINAFLDPPNPLAGPAWTQASLANQLLGKKAPGCIANPIPGSCNKPERLDVALTITRNMMPDGYLTNQHLTFDCIQNWVNVQLPLGARITWFGGGAHFIALDGCKVMSNGQRMVHVQDPSFSPASSPGLWDYDALVEDYLEQGYWSDTYLVTANPNA